MTNRVGFLLGVFGGGAAFLAAVEKIFKIFQHSEKNVLDISYSRTMCVYVCWRRRNDKDTLDQHQEQYNRHHYRHQVPTLIMLETKNCLKASGQSGNQPPNQSCHFPLENYAFMSIVLVAGSFQFDLFRNLT